MSGAPIALGELAVRMPQVTQTIAAAHGALFRTTRGRALRRWFGSPILVLETIGRRTGAVRRVPLVYLPDGDDLVVVPANAGADAPPAWWLNLQAAGVAVADLGHERRDVRPAVATGARRDRLWRRHASVTPVDHYQRRTARCLPVVLLTRIRASQGSLKERP
jgi:F420H(2)-dependent quinone reductase